MYTGNSFKEVKENIIVRNFALAAKGKCFSVLVESDNFGGIQKILILLKSAWKTRLNILMKHRYLEKKFESKKLY